MSTRWVIMIITLIVYSKSYKRFSVTYSKWRITIPIICQLNIHGNGQVLLKHHQWFLRCIELVQNIGSGIVPLKTMLVKNTLAIWHLLQIIRKHYWQSMLANVHQPTITDTLMMHRFSITLCTYNSVHMWVSHDRILLHQHSPIQLPLKVPIFGERTRGIWIWQWWDCQWFTPPVDIT